MGVFIKGYGNLDTNMVRDLIKIIKDIHMRELINLETQTDMENQNGRVAVSMRVALKKGIEMALEAIHGHPEKPLKGVGN